MNKIFKSSHLKVLHGIKSIKPSEYMNNFEWGGFLTPYLNYR